MTVTTIDRRKTYPGNGSATTFIGPRLFDATELDVYLVDDGTQIAVLQSTPSQYALTGVGLPASSVAFVTPPPIGQTVLLLRTLEITQPTRFRNQGAFFPELHEDSFDRTVLQQAQIKEQADRSLRLQDTFVGTVDTELPPPSALAPLVWNASGTGVENGSTILTGDMLLRPNLADASDPAKGAALVGFKQTGTGAVGRDVSDELGEIIKPEQFGALADDTTASQPAMALTVTQAQTAGGTIQLQRGVYKLAYASGDAALNIDSPITGEPDVDRRAVTLVGQGAGNTVIKGTTTAKYAVKLTGGTGVDAHGYENHRDFSIVAGIAGSDGLWLFNKALTSLENITLQGCNTGLLLESVVSCSFRNITCGNNAIYGAHVKTGTGFSGCNSNTFDSCNFRSNVVLGLHSEARVTDLTFINCNFENNGRHGNASEGGCELVFDSTQGLGGAAFIGGYFESNKGGADLFLTNTGSDYMTVTMVGTTFNRNIAASYVTNCIKTTGKIRLILQGCTFASYNGYTPSAGRPYITGDADLILVHDGCVFKDALEAPAQYSTRDRLSFAGSLTSAGAANLLPAGWTCSKLGTGSYRVTHNLAVSAANKYSVSAVTNGGAATFVLSTSKATNTFDVATVNTGFAATDAAFDFTLTRA